jgi:uncharacterized membrane protein (UPF0127 family)
VVAAVLVLAGCSSDGTGAVAPGDPTTSIGSGPGTSVAGGSLRGPQGFGAVTLVVTMPDGTVREWCAWSADTPELRSQGLMAVTDPSLGGAAAMVFAFPEDTASGFWMKGTPLPLSIAWFAADGSFVSDADMEPCPEGVENCPSTAPGSRYRYAVEVVQGDLERLGLVAGASISLGSACTPEPASA